MKRFMMLVLGTALGVALWVPAGAQNTTGSTTQKQTTPAPKKETKEEKKARKEAERAKKKQDAASKKGTTPPANKNDTTKQK
jgi:hypothetical protein